MFIIKRMYQYDGAMLGVTRTSPDSATVDLKCGEHDHQDFIVGLMEDEAVGWVVGRKESGHQHEGSFVDAVEHAADLLIQECKAMVQVDRFFIPIT